MHPRSFFLSLLILFLLSGCTLSQPPISKEIPTNEPLLFTRDQAMEIGKRHCISAEESLSLGHHDASTQIWWFGANLLEVRNGCSPACVVSEKSKSAELKWICLITDNTESESRDAIRDLFAQKFPRYAKTINILIQQKTENHMRGGVSFEPGAPGGYFFAMRRDDLWQIILHGNGQIACEILSQNEFPAQMLLDCAE